MTVTLILLLRRAFAERIRFSESARCLVSSHQVPSSREDVPMLHNRRGLLFAGVAALALLDAGARTAPAQDAVVRGPITSDRAEPIPGANAASDALSRRGTVRVATGTDVDKRLRPRAGSALHRGRRHHQRWTARPEPGGHRKRRGGEGRRRRVAVRRPGG